jgi:hypothetical protein
MRHNREIQARHRAQSGGSVFLSGYSSLFAPQDE